MNSSQATSTSTPHPPSLPSEIWLKIAEYLSLATKIQLGYVSKSHERLMFGNKNIVDFENLSIPAALTDQGLKTFLVRINASQIVKSLKLSNSSIMESGDGLIPLHGSAVLESLDLLDMEWKRDEEEIDPSPLHLPSLEAFICSILQTRMLKIKCSAPIFTRDNIAQHYVNRWVEAGFPLRCGCDYCTEGRFPVYLAILGPPYCFHCNTWYCIDDSEWISCTGCQEKWCSKCVPATCCVVCRSCVDCHTQFGPQTCLEPTCCRWCSQNCPKCQETYCPKHHVVRCDSCNLNLCRRCNDACEMCRQTLCYGCKVQDGCDLCCPFDETQDDEEDNQAPLENYGYWGMVDDD
mmetsp:Transcript_33272/g.54923  ORF Transcript_33272/g.54923 Transcript_33272/m.54923 type:complete len:349 (-) Transcript_33272:280-1326(-)